MNVILVDDEPKAIALLSSYLAHFSNFNLVETFRNGLKALEYLNNNTVDVVFLDINMPHLSGLSLSKMLPKETAIVFTTAYSEHALESYDVHTVDYLLKPISLERFSKSITKLLAHKNIQTPPVIKQSINTIFIKSGQQIHQVDLEEILYLQKDGNYINYHLSTKRIMGRQSISEALSNLPNNFIQVQKSYIVNFSKITTIQTDSLIIDKTQIPIGNQFKPNLLARLK
ncbi:LytR/AlgR family response regulator transcription factor [Flavivirga rizhaonensis]|uniref:Response regulator transcription factor n=1 Tax=Flavivirga rizhaonensis TaxID=2559571 RepID=A0A4V3P5B7_9FLAO|nr:LytTR family DNA-binding domain-containing protein [Flavivirga rizhaonensis]TGV04734.1 response regulator transcription factor [Flavivirga rizhaonensis]